MQLVPSGSISSFRDPLSSQSAAFFRCLPPGRAPVLQALVAGRRGVEARSSRRCCSCLVAGRGILDAASTRASTRRSVVVRQGAARKGMDPTDGSDQESTTPPHSRGAGAGGRADGDLEVDGGVVLGEEEGGGGGPGEDRGSERRRRQ